MLLPVWPQVKVGPILRRETDKRSYVGLFRNNGQHVGVLHSVARKIFARKYCEDEMHAAGEGDVVNVSGMKGLFEPLAGYNTLILSRLQSILTPSVKASVHETSRGSYIAIHVRLGDFGTNAQSALGPSRGQNNTRIGIEWYVNALQAVRQSLGDDDYPARVFSDGADHELKELLMCKGVERCTSGSAVGDILCLGRSRVLIASASTFSMWASFLGQPFTVWFPGQMRSQLHMKDGTEVEFKLGERIGVSLSD